MWLVGAAVGKVLVLEDMRDVDIGPIPASDHVLEAGLEGELPVTREPVKYKLLLGTLDLDAASWQSVELQIEMHAEDVKWRDKRTVQTIVQLLQTKIRLTVMPMAKVTRVMQCHLSTVQLGLPVPVPMMV